MADNERNTRQNWQSRSRQESAQISKLVQSSLSSRSYDRKGNRTPQEPPMSLLQDLSERTASVSQDLQSIKQLLPDIELAAQILVSSILSPKDMGTAHLNFTYNSNLSVDELGGQLNRVIQNYFEDEYKINDQLSDMLYNILFETGAEIRMVVPESSVDELINGSTQISIESMQPFINRDTFTMKPLGILANPSNRAQSSQESVESITLESVFPPNAATTPNQYTGIGKNDMIRVTDNPDAVKMPRLIEKNRRETVNRAFAGQKSRRRSMESRNQTQRDENGNVIHIDPEKMSDREVERTLDRGRKFKRERVTQVKTKDQVNREMQGHPMVMKLSSEAVIPAHTPSSPKEHIGYFVLLDQYGYPISTDTAADHYRDLQRSFQESSSQNTIKQVMQDLRGFDGAQHASQSQYQSLTEATNAFADIIERDLLDRMRRGGNYAGAELERPSEVYQIMLSRAMQKKQSQLLFVPSELVSYMAFAYTKHGIGKSLLEDSRILGSIRILVMFANTMASVHNATNQTTVKVQLDPEDSDPMSTIGQVKDAVMRSRADQYPLGESDPASQIRFLQQAGVSVTYSGHDALPEMDVDVSHDGGNHAKVDRELEEQLRHSHIMSMGISPETVDVSRGVDFATSVVNSSLLLNKRVAMYQKRFEPMLCSFIQQYTRNSQILYDELIQVVENYFKEKKELQKKEEQEKKEQEGDQEGDQEENQEGSGEQEGEGSQESVDKDEEEKSAEDIVEEFIDAIEVSLPRPDTISMEAQMEAFEDYTRGLDDAIEAWVSDEFVQEDLDEDMARRLREFQKAVRSYYVRRWLRENNVFPELEEFTQRDEDGALYLPFAQIQSSHVNALYEQLDSYMERFAFDKELREQNKEELRKSLKEEYGYSENEEAPSNDTEAPPESGGEDDTGGGDTGGGGFDFDI